MKCSVLGRLLDLVMKIAPYVSKNKLHFNQTITCSKSYQDLMGRILCFHEFAYG